VRSLYQLLPPADMSDEGFFLSTSVHHMVAELSRDDKQAVSFGFFVLFDRSSISVAHFAFSFVLSLLRRTLTRVA